MTNSTKQSYAALIMELLTDLEKSESGSRRQFLSAKDVQVQLARRHNQTFAMSRVRTCLDNLAKSDRIAKRKNDYNGRTSYAAFRSEEGKKVRADRRAAERRQEEDRKQLIEVLASQGIVAELQYGEVALEGENATALLSLLARHGISS